VQQQLRTVIKIGEHGQRIEHHHHHFHAKTSGSCVDTPYSMTPAQSVENFHHSIDDGDDDEQVPRDLAMGKPGIGSFYNMNFCPWGLTFLCSTFPSHTHRP
jgi:hypothetical protein